MKKANPALGDFRSLADVKRLAAQAQRMPSTENSFRNLILNQRGTTQTPFISPPVWNECGGALYTIPAGAAVYAGLDLGSTRDMSSLVLAYEYPIDGLVTVQPHYWLPGNIEESDRRRIARPNAEWIRKGYIASIGPGAIARRSTIPIRVDAGK